MYFEKKPDDGSDMIKQIQSIADEDFHAPPKEDDFIDKLGTDKYADAWKIINDPESTAVELQELSNYLSEKYQNEILGNASVPEQWRKRREELWHQINQKANGGENFSDLMKEWYSFDTALNTPSFKNYELWKKEKDYIERLREALGFVYRDKTEKH